MEEELENLGIELAKLAKKYCEDYLSLSYVSGSIQGFSDTHKDEYTSIYLDQKEVEERCLKEQN